MTFRVTKPAPSISTIRINLVPSAISGRFLPDSYSVLKRSLLYQPNWCPALITAFQMWTNRINSSWKLTESDTDKYLPEGKASEYFTLNVGKTGQRFSAFLFCRKSNVVVRKAWREFCSGTTAATLCVKVNGIFYVTVRTELVTVCTTYFKVK
jgi:hypothetical protein